LRNRQVLKPEVKEEGVIGLDDESGKSAKEDDVVV